MAVTGRWRWSYVIAWGAILVALIVIGVLRATTPQAGPSIRWIDDRGVTRRLSLAEMKRLPALARRGSYQNQYGNWRDEGHYTGVPIAALIGEDAEYRSVRVTASDGYRVEIERARIESEAYPIVLAYAFDGLEIPAWKDGPRIAVLPEGGGVSNEEYNAVSAGSFWVKGVVEVELLR